MRYTLCCISRDAERVLLRECLVFFRERVSCETSSAQSTTHLNSAQWPTLQKRRQCSSSQRRGGAHRPRSGCTARSCPISRCASLTQSPRYRRLLQVWFGASHREAAFASPSPHSALPPAGFPRVAATCLTAPPTDSSIRSSSLFSASRRLLVSGCDFMDQWESRLEQRPSQHSQ